MYVEKPSFYKKPNLTNWKDKRGPDGTTIIAPYEQATPAMYPGVKPEKMEGEVFLFNLDKDIAEMHNVAEENPEIVAALQEEYEEYHTWCHYHHLYVSLYLYIQQPLSIPIPVAATKILWFQLHRLLFHK